MTNKPMRQIPTKNLELDWKNPRISEFGVTSQSSPREIYNILWKEMAVNELMISIVSNGYWDYEPLIVLSSGDKYITIEGNRRLAAVKILLDPSLIEDNIPSAIEERRTKSLLSTLEKLPAVVVEKRQEAWEYVGFKHVNGPAKWGSYAKAKYIAEVHNDYGIPLKDIAFQIGDTHNTAQKLYQALMVLEQADKKNIYKKDDVQASRIYFSHLYTGLQRNGIRSYLNIQEADKETTDPVPVENEKKLGELLEWLFGSKRNNTQAVVRSQNPDLKRLDNVLQSPDATAALKDGDSLEYCFDLSRSSDELFEESLLAAKRNLLKARAYTTQGYKGEDSLLKVAGSTADLADALYEEMLAINKKEKGSSRISE